ncbi:helix-turn-helix domain-containing protein [Yeosuana marina]|uniref:helix-turn-helix domain-containing protein n=1 Tax=Yeosuana marina TaxID=1565536 RepID=UPI0014249E33|nr:helix-turn-helix domain-containing protein [Yeosuana marina]
MKTFEQIILLLVSGQGLLLSFALLSSILKKNYSSFFLGIITTVITLEILNIWGMRTSYHSLENAFPFWVFGSYLSLPPALWMFVKLNTEPTFQLKPKYSILFIPALIEIIIELFSFYSNRLLWTKYDLIENSFWYILTEIVPVISMIVVLIFFAKELNRLNKRLKKMPIAKNKFFQNLRLYLFFIVFSLLTLFWSLITIFDFQVFMIIEILLLFFLFALGYIGYFKPSFFDIPKILKTEIIKENFSQYDDDKELKRLNLLFENEKIFTKQKLSLKEVASRLHLPERYVSVIINSYHNTTFTSYVNSFRVADVIERIKDPKESNKTLLGIAMESGFNSKSSFNSIFKATTGKNPSSFLKK